MQEQIARNVVEELSKVEKSEQLEIQLKNDIAQADASNEGMKTVLKNLYMGGSNEGNPWRKHIEMAFAQEGTEIQQRQDMEAYVVWESLKVDVFGEALAHNGQPSIESQGPGKGLAHNGQPSIESQGPGKGLAHNGQPSIESQGPGKGLA